MRVLLITLMLLACAACGAAGDDSNNHGYGWRVDQVGASGLRLQCNATCAPSTMQSLETAFFEVMQCTGIQAPPPFVVIVPYEDIAPLNGFTYFEPPTVKLEPALIVLRHEYVHYLLIMSGFPREDNEAHNSPFFSTCG